MTAGSFEDVGDFLFFHFWRRKMVRTSPCSASMSFRDVMTMSAMDLRSSTFRLCHLRAASGS